MDECGIVSTEGSVLDMLLKDYRELREESDALERKLETLKKKMTAVQDRITAKMVEQGVRSVKFPCGATAYIRFNMYCNLVPDCDRMALIDNLRSAGLDHLISFSPQALKSHVKNFMEEKAGDDWAADPEADPRIALPQTVRDQFNIYTEMKATVIGL